MSYKRDFQEKKIWENDLLLWCNQCIDCKESCGSEKLTANKKLQFKKHEFDANTVEN